MFTRHWKRSITPASQIARGKERFLHVFYHLTLIIPLVVLTLGTFGVSPARAATTWIVTNLADGAASPTNCPNAINCRLRDALAAASTGDTITFAGSLSAQTIYLSSTLTLSQDVTIDGSLLLDKITISGDTSNDGTGDVRVFSIDSGVTATLDSLIITKGKSPAFGGGAILNNGNLTVHNSAISDSSATGNGGGGILNWGGALTVSNSRVINNSAGSGIVNYNGTATITGSTLSGNSDDFMGGGLWNDGTMTIENSTISNNAATSGSGGGIYNNGGALTITNGFISNNSAGNPGGGIYNLGDLLVTDSTFSGNSGTNGGGINTTASGTLSVTNSAFTSNTASQSGGGVYSQSNGVTIANSTFSGNSALLKGGGIYNPFAYTLTVTNSTISGNSAPASKGGGVYTEGTLNYANTIIANSVFGGDCTTGVIGSIGTNNNNLAEDGSCSSSLSGDPALQALANNGGPTQTMALLPGSPAIDAGDDSTCAASPVNNLDQRGVARPAGIHCDIGAYEGTIPTITITFKSTAAQDGWILESSETSNSGGAMNPSATIYRLGDDASNRQYRAILSFNTASLPDNAVITSAVIKIKQNGPPSGSNPFNALGNLFVDIRKPYFGSAAGLQLTDFNASASGVKVGAFSKTPTGGWYRVSLNASGRNQINKINLTQFRLYFSKDDNNDLGADYMKFLSGNAPVANRPILVVLYYVP